MDNKIIKRKVSIEVRKNRFVNIKKNNRDLHYIVQKWQNRLPTVC